MVSCYISITGSLMMFKCFVVTSIEYSNMVPETLDSYIYYMVSCYISITGSLLIFKCVVVTNIDYCNMVPETLDSYSQVTN